MTEAERTRLVEDLRLIAAAATARGHIREAERIREAAAFLAFDGQRLKEKATAG